MFKNGQNKNITYLIIGGVLGFLVLLWTLRTISDAWADSKQTISIEASSSAGLNIIQLNQAIESMKKRGNSQQ